MAHIPGLVVAITVAAALTAVTCYGLSMIVLAVVASIRSRRADPIDEDLDAFLSGLLGPRDQVPAASRSDPAGPRRRPHRIVSGGRRRPVG